MPLYEYNCRDCSAEFELLVRADEKPHCPECDSAKLEKLLSVTASPQGGTGDLPMSRSMPGGGCGKPQCGPGGCMI
jgi:putative FmdB family regulatory protein